MPGQVEGGRWKPLCVATVCFCCIRELSSCIRVLESSASALQPGTTSSGARSSPTSSRRATRTAPASPRMTALLHLMATST